MRLAIEYSETQTKIYQKIKVLPFERQDFYFLIFIGINGYKRRRGGDGSCSHMPWSLHMPRWNGER